MIKKTFVIFSLFTGTMIYSQNIKTKTQPEITGTVAYFIENKLMEKDQLVLIKPEEIESVNSIKRDTIVDGQKYAGQIFVVLKSPLKKEN